MLIMGNGYSRNQYLTGMYQDVVKDVAKNLPELMEHVGADSVAVMGKSGISMIFGIQMVRPVPFMVVRKPNESSHGNMVEGTSGHQFKRYIILDDFVCTGETVRNIVLGVRNNAESMYEEDMPVCVGVAEYQSQFFTSWSEGYRNQKRLMNIMQEDGVRIQTIPVFPLKRI